MAGEYDARFQALDDKIETNRLAVQEQLRVVSDTLVRHGVSLTRLEGGQARLETAVARLDEGQGRLEGALADQGRLLAEVLRRLPEPGEDLT